MSVLARGTESDHTHYKVLGSHEGKLFTDATRNDGRVDNEAGYNVVEYAEENISCEEGVRDIDAADGAGGVSCQEASDCAMREEKGGG